MKRAVVSTAKASRTTLRPERVRFVVEYLIKGLLWDGVLPYGFSDSFIERGGHGWDKGKMRGKLRDNCGQCPPSM
jgi:hypothetical protein